MSALAYSGPLSERLARAIRTDDLSEVGRMSPVAACLMPLLEALGWRSYGNDIIEALPHFADELDLVDLRNILVSLGYDSDTVDVRLPTVDRELLPCLFVSNNDELLVLLDTDGDQITYFDPGTQQRLTGRLNQRGTAYVFTDTHASHAVSEEPAGAWFPRLVRRFKRLVKYLLVMTGILNLLALAVPLFIMTVYDKVIGTGVVDALPYLAGGMVLVLCVELGLRFLRARTLGLIAGRLDYLIGVETFKQLMLLPPLMTERSSVAAQLSTLKQFDSVRDFFTGPASTLALEAPFVVLFIAVIWLIAGPMAFIPIVVLSIYALFALLWLPAMNDRVVHAGAARTARQHMLMETMNGLRELKALGAESVWRERYRETSSDTLASLYRTATSQAVLESVTFSLMTLAGVAVLGLGTMRVMHGDMSIGALIAVMALVWRVLGPIQTLFLAYVKFDQIAAGVRTLNQLMKLPTEPTSGKSALLSPQIAGGVRFDRLSFKYSPTANPAILGVSLDVKPREFVAVLGNNASGKSTLLKLIAGMYTAQSGSIYIDDTDTRQFNPMDLRRLIAYVPQNPVLYHGTIAQNLRFKNVMATDDELRQAAADAGVLDAIEQLPQGFETRIGDNATDRLPSGLVHGLTVARAFVKAAPILLLDEPGASLDHDADAVLIERLNHLKGKRTILLVSHRPSHIRIADRAVVLGDGMIQFSGTPDEALQLMFGRKT